MPALTIEVEQRLGAEEDLRPRDLRLAPRSVEEVDRGLRKHQPVVVHHFEALDEERIAAAFEGSAVDRGHSRRSEDPK